MLGCARKIAAAAAAISLGVTSSVAATVVPAARPANQALDVPAPAATPNQWLTLSMMTASTSVTATAQAEGDVVEAVSWPHTAPLSVVLATIATAIYILLEEDDGNGSAIVQGVGLTPTPLSPA